MRQRDTAEEENSMIAQMSEKSKIYHRPGCSYISRIYEPYRTAFDMDDHKIKDLKPCKYCCNLNTMYRKYEPQMQETFKNMEFQVEQKKKLIDIHTAFYHWSIILKPSDQNLVLRRVEDHVEYKELDEEKELHNVMQYIASQERLAIYPEPFRDQAIQMKVFAEKYQIQLEYDRTDLYILTDMAAWKITYSSKYDRFKLLHSPFGERQLTMDQAKTAHYHVQGDVPRGQLPYKDLEYIYKHDKAKKIENDNYKNLPHRTKKEKKYYRQAEHREQRRSANRMWDLLTQLETNKG